MNREIWRRCGAAASVMLMAGCAAHTRSAPPKPDVVRGAIRPVDRSTPEGVLAPAKYVKPPQSTARPDVTPAPTPRTAPAALDSTELPKIGDYVYVEELPEAITRVPPIYPDKARLARIEGTVMMQAFVGIDGSVHETRVVKSIPALDAAAAACLMRWKFKPALAGKQPVAVWVGVPIRFSLE